MNCRTSIASFSSLQRGLGDYALGVALAFLLPLCAFAQSAPVASTTCPAFTSTITPGATDAKTGGEVSVLQKFLSAYASTTQKQLVSGFFGSSTKTNLLQFQAQQNIATSGVVDAATRAAITKLCGPSAAFSNMSLTSLRADALVSGTSANLTAPLVLSILQIGGTKIYETEPVPVTDDSWSLRLFPPLSNGTYEAELSSSNIVLATSTLEIGLKSFPSVALDPSLPSFDIVDGRLMDFTVTAQNSGPVELGQFAFTVMPTNATVTGVTLSGYTDSGYSEPISSSTEAMAASVTDPTPAPFGVTLSPTIEVPAGKTYYFELDGTVTPSATTYYVETTLLGDGGGGVIDSAVALASTSNFIWSPDTYGTASTSDIDWTNGSLVTGVPENGLLLVRTNTPASSAPTCQMSASTSTAAGGTPVTLSWSSTNAATAIWEDTKSSVALQGSKVSSATTTHTYIMDFQGQYGETTCFATVAVPGVVSTSTTQGATTTPDGFSATPTSGSVSLAVAFNGSVNNAKSCAAQTFSLGFGDASTSTIPVAANLCKAQSFSLNHTYTKTGTYTAELFKGTGTSTSELIQKQVITVSAKVGLLFDPFSEAANALSALLMLLSLIHAPFI